MVNEELKKYGHPGFYKLLDQMAELHSRKNHDYAGTSDPLRNLRACSRIGMDPFIGVLIRLQDKWSRLESLSTADPLVANESIEDTLLDNAVYSLLAIILRREKQQRAEVKSITPTIEKLEQDPTTAPASRITRAEQGQRGKSDQEMREAGYIYNYSTCEWIRGSVSLAKKLL